MLIAPLAIGLALQFNPNTKAQNLSLLTQSETSQAQKVGSAASWKINDVQALIWNGQSTIFYGLNTNGDLKDLQEDYDLGCRTFCLNLPVSGPQWQPAIQWLEDHQCHYFIRISSAAPQSVGYPVDPVGYRIHNITQETKLNIPMPGVQKVFSVSAIERDGTIEKTYQTPITDGNFKVDVQPMNDMAHVLLMYPLTDSLQIPDFWLGTDTQRDHLLSSLSLIKNKSGLRGIIDPLGKLVTIPKPDLHFVPTSQGFRQEFAAYLRNKYHDLSVLFRSWQILAPDQSSFDQVARLVPLWAGEKGVRALYDPVSGNVYKVDDQPSGVWTDIQTVINLAAARRYDRLTQVIHSLVDVPVFQTWNGWGVPYEHGAEVDGISFRCTGNSPLGLLHDAVRAESSALRSGQHMALLAAKYQPSKLSDQDLSDSLQDLQSLNVSGVFLNSDNSKEKAQFLKVSSGLQKEPFSQIHALYYPEAATNPADAQRLGGGMWWLPSPINGNRLELGSNIKGYEMSENGKTSYVIWSAQGAFKETFDSHTGNDAVVTSSAPVDLALHSLKTGFTMTLPSLPVKIDGLDSMPSPVSLYGKTVEEFQYLMAYRQSLHQDSLETEVAFNNAKDSYPRNPGVALLSMRKAIRTLAMQCGSFLWRGCSNPDSMVFGERIADPSAISPEVWEMTSELQMPKSTESVTYTVMPKTKDSTSLWLAAKIDPTELSKVHIRIGDQIFGLTGPAMGEYGIGYGWYKVGNVTLAGQTKIEVDIDGSQPFSVRLDAIVLTPTQFSPNGTTLPQTPEQLAEAVPEQFKKKKPDFSFSSQ